MQHKYNQHRNKVETQSSNRGRNFNIVFVLKAIESSSDSDQSATSNGSFGRKYAIYVAILNNGKIIM